MDIKSIISQMTLEEKALIDILKNKWRFDGFIVADWYAVSSMVNSLKNPKAKAFLEDLIKSIFIY